MSRRPLAEELTDEDIDRLADELVDVVLRSKQAQEEQEQQEDLPVPEDSTGEVIDAFDEVFGG